ncbi:MAG: tRNA pseudouridine(38-40) synthase TruA, partial [Oscillospiraceae bacterium]
TTVRTIYWCNISHEDNIISMRVCANGFLYNMVRAIAGTLVYVGLGKLSPEEIPRLLELCDRRLTGPTMPPQGLYMSQLWYEGAVGDMMAK